MEEGASLKPQPMNLTANPSNDNPVMKFQTVVIRVIPMIIEFADEKKSLG